MGLEDQIYTASPRWLRSVWLHAHAVRIQRHRFGSRYHSMLDQFAVLATAEPRVVREFQMARLAHVVRIAASRSNFYRERFRNAGLRPEDIDGLEALRKLPVLSKQELRSELGTILTESNPGRGWLHGHTSGTTGSPLSLWYDQETCYATNAGDRLQKRWAGVDDNEWIGLMLGRQIIPRKQSTAPYWHANHVQRQVWFSSLHMSNHTLPAYVSEMRRRRLQALEGYPSTLYVLARYLLDKGERLTMGAVFSSSETLLELQREAIQEAFQAPLYDFYGHAERAIFAIECAQHNGKHLLEPFGITEVVDSNDQPVPDGQLGYLVGTSLYNTAMPLLRYRTGDISAIDRSPCSCGSSSPRIVNVSTKAEDIIVLPDGRWLSPSALTHPFKPFPELLESQIVQEALDFVRVRIVTSSEFSESREAQLVDGLRDRLGAGVKVELERVEKIQREESGKFRWVISRVPHAMSINWTQPRGLL